LHHDAFLFEPFEKGLALQVGGIIVLHADFQSGFGFVDEDACCEFPDRVVFKFEKLEVDMAPGVAHVRQKVGVHRVEVRVDLQGVPVQRKSEVASPEKIDQILFRRLGTAAYLQGVQS